MPVLWKGDVIVVVLYTLPTCGICKVIKSKMEKANIDFNVAEGEDFFIQNGYENAPILQLEDGELLTSPIAINNWIKNR